MNLLYFSERTKVAIFGLLRGDRGGDKGESLKFFLGGGEGTTGSSVLSGLLLPHKLHRGKRKRLQIISLSSFSPPPSVCCFAFLPPSLCCQGEGGIGGGGEEGLCANNKSGKREKREGGEAITLLFCVPLG